ncbi:methyl-accepting chemotaxis protein 4 [Paraliobacillus ryukyuensis]|uniref:Methyl-accepting chemotaxis protein n=1 Tax=Paraliobacillus ryukyuensis TaxID=200904 RepID=A0A366EBP0_9BACI|nr:HAMP domain-containing methyl-accepting chemotaxis protein [Paraliobacillus ryukyuensis]RBO99465.1 methyl-accepting chemotaxis protein [Paraliobacillus ryukyuensis]
MKKSNNTVFWNKIQFRIIILLIVVLLVNSTITNFILRLIDMTGINLGMIGIWLNNFMNVIVATTIIGVFLQYFVIKPIKTMESKIRDFENNEANVQIETKSKNELDMLGNRLNELFTYIRSYHDSQQEQINLVEGKSSTISNKINQMTDNVSSLQHHFETITASSQEQLSAFEQTSTVVDNMNGQFQSIAKDVDEITSSFHNMRSNTEEGVADINDSSQTMVNIAQQSQDAKNNILELSKEVGKINEVVTLINDISEQTNLLALNASIEAARAGEHGKGFSIVADEIRGLAERSVRATERISETVEHILSNVDEIAKQSEDRAYSIDKESNNILAINNRFVDIKSTIISNIDRIEEMNEHTKTLTQSSNEISDTMEQVTNNTEQTTEQLVELNNTVSSTLDEMNKVKEEVQMLNQSFKKIR